MTTKKFTALALILFSIGFGITTHHLRAQSFSSQSGGWAATSGSIGGSLLTVGATASGTLTINGVQVGMQCNATATDGTNMVALGAVPTCTVTSANTVTVNLIAILSLTPASKTYNVRVWP